MTNVKLPFEILDGFIKYGDSVEYDGDTFTRIEYLGEDTDDDFKQRTYIYQRKSDGKYFRSDLTFIRYGYEWYEFESDYNDGELIEVEKREKVITTWEAV